MNERGDLQSFWQAHLETERLTFDAYGAAKLEAEAAMVRTTKRHCRQYMVDWSRFFIRYWGEVEYVEVRFGSGWRDGEEIWGGRPEDEVEEAMLAGRRQEYSGPL
jgi:hypothetical protein